MSKTWLIGDTHFNHSNIIEYTNRPFDDVEQMNDTIIENWNKQVKPSDVVIHLGDFAMGNKVEQKAVFDQLQGIIKLVMGNHDRLKVRDYYEMGFAEVYRYPILLNKILMLSHEPIVMPKNNFFYNVHGHIHVNDAPSKYHINLCVEKTNYQLVSLNSIMRQTKE